VSKKSIHSAASLWNSPINRTPQHSYRTRISCSRQCTRTTVLRTTAAVGTRKKCCCRLRLTVVTGAIVSRSFMVIYVTVCCTCITVSSQKIKKGWMRCIPNCALKCGRKDLGSLLVGLRLASDGTCAQSEGEKILVSTYWSNISNRQTSHIYPMWVNKTLYHLPRFVIFCCLLVRDFVTQRLWFWFCYILVIFFPVISDFGRFWTSKCSSRIRHVLIHIWSRFSFQ